MKETLPRRVSARLRFSLRLESGSGVEGELRLKREREPRGFKQLQKTNLLSSFASDNTYYVVQGFALITPSALKIRLTELEVLSQGA
jgi:hypothetical protein